VHAAVALLWASRLPAMEQNLQNLSLAILRGDHHFKLPGKATRGLFAAIYTLLNEFEQIVAAPLLYSTKNAELLPMFHQLLQRQIATGQKTGAFYVDNPLQVRHSIPLRFVSDPHPQPNVPANVPVLTLPDGCLVCCIVYLNVQL
jgi:hypothetical protein